MESVVFGQFKQNPEHFIAEASRLINSEGHHHHRAPEL